MADNKSLRQPWTEWYKPENTIENVHYVVPVMAAGNQAPAVQKNGRLDLSKSKEFPNDNSRFTNSVRNEPVKHSWKEWYVTKTNPDGDEHYVIPIMAADNLTPALKVNTRLDLSKPKAP